MRRALALSLALVLGCAAAPPRAPAPPSGADVAALPTPPARLEMVHDDAPAAMARARAEGKVLVVDAWAPWCHTCLSMQSYVLSDPALAPLAERAVFLAIDTDKEQNAPFLERHAVAVWPTYFVIDPVTDRTVGYLPGSASVREMRAFVEEGARAAELARGGGGDDATRAIVEGHAALASRDLARAAASYERAAALGGPRKGEALASWLLALYAAKDWAACARVGRERLADVTGWSASMSFAGAMTWCAGRLGKTPEAAATIAPAVARLEQLAREAPPDASADDRADTLATIADAREASGDAAGARRANEERLSIMEKAAAEAKTPAVAATYDYGRAGAYLALGRGEDAVKMLEARERELPGLYEPPARLADVLLELGRYPDALAAVDRAIQRAYGPRRLRYLGTRATILGKLGDHAAELEALRAVVAGFEALPPGHASPDRLADAKRRLAEAEARR